MENMLKVYIYQDGDRPIFHEPLLDGIYASEGWFMKLMEANKQFVTRDPVSVTNMGEENVKQPLLERKYYKDCPGCKVDQAKELSEGKGVPVKNLFIMWMVVLCAGN